MKLLLSIFLAVTFVSAGLLEQANEKFNAGKTEEAIALYKKAALNGENPVLSYFNMANGYYQLDSMPQAINYYRACTGYAPGFFRAWLNLSTAYFKLEDMAETIGAVSRALMVEPNNSKALFILATAYRKANSIPDAIVTYERLISVAPENHEGYMALAEMYSDLEDYDKAMFWLAKYPEDGGNEGYITILQAELAGKKGDKDSELYYLRQAIAKNPENRWVYYRLVEAMLRNGNKLVALDEASRGLDQFPDFGDLAILAGNTAFELQDMNKAERFYTIGRNSGNANAVIGLENVRIMRANSAMN